MRKTLSRPIKMRSTDKAWNRWGLQDPYFAVLTLEEYRQERLSDESKKQFFQTGQQHYDHVLATIRAHLGAPFNPKRALDFGCGTGRVLLAMARSCEEVLGVDISDSMLSECRANCRAAGVHNVSLGKSDDRLSAASGEYDLVHSFIVFQHIPARRGERLVSKLLEHLRRDGVAVLHFVYGWEATLRQRIAYWIRHHIPLAHAFMNRLRRKPVSDPKMQMNVYDTNRLFRRFAEAGTRILHTEFVRHGAHLGVVFYLCKQNDTARP